MHSFYSEYVRRKTYIVFLCYFLLVIVCLFSACAGTIWLSPIECIKIFVGALEGTENTILMQIRFPRILTACFVGMVLALAGVIMQNVLRNPLASSSTLGVSQGASFGAAIAIVYFNAGLAVQGSSSIAMQITSPYIVSCFAFLGGIISIGIIAFLSLFARLSSATVVLAGVALSSLCVGGIAIVQYYADDIKVASIVYWTFGDLGRTSWQEIGVLAFVIVLSFGYFYRQYWLYNAIESGVQSAKSLGVQVEKIMLVSLILSALIVSLAVAFVGTISFIGLVAPHIARKFVGNNYRFLIPLTMGIGAILLVLAELVSRIIISPSILPIGALTSFLGAPVFLYLLVKKGNLRDLR